MIVIHKYEWSSYEPRIMLNAVHESHLILTQTLPYTYDSPCFTCLKAELQRLNDASNVPKLATEEQDLNPRRQWG